MVSGVLLGQAIDEGEAADMPVNEGRGTGTLAISCEKSLRS